MSKLNNRMSINDFRSDIDQWTDMWDEMQSDLDINPLPQKIQPSTLPATNKGDNDYYDYLDYLASAEIIQEEKVQNPIYPDSAGPDQESPKPAWVNEDLLKEVESLKKKLFKLENKMAKMDQGKKLADKKTHKFDDKSMFAEIKLIRDKIDKVSSQLGIKDEPSPWKIKRD